MKKLWWNIKWSLFKHFLVKRLGIKCPSTDIKYEFEKDLISIIKKYNFYRVENALLQGIEIKVTVDNLPKINLDYVLYDGTIE